jgi:hypothetical protein
MVEARADRREVKTKHADWQDLLSDGADIQASALYFGRPSLGIAGQFFVFRGRQIEAEQ